MRTTDIGNLSTVKCMQAFLEAGYLIIRPEYLGHTLLRLRVSPTANNQAKKIRWARDFEILPLAS